MDQMERAELIKEYYGAWRETIVIYEDWAKSFGLTYYAWMVLDTIWSEKEGCTQKQICQQWILPKQTVNMILKDFDRKGWIRFDVMENDRRNKVVRLTEAGEKLARELMPALEEMEMEVLGEMGDARVGSLIENTNLFTELLRAQMKERKECENNS